MFFVCVSMLMLTEINIIKRWSGVGIVRSPQMSNAVVEFSPENEEVTSMPQHVAGRKAVTVVCAYGLNSNLEYPVSLDSVWL